MTLTWLGRSGGRADRHPPRGRRGRTRLAVEGLEDRTVPAVAFAVTDANALVRFDTATPGTVVSSQPITGLAAGESVLGIDFRPATGQLYALGSTSRLYTLDYTSNPTATATPVGSPGAFTLSGTSFGFDFNPTVDRIRVVSDTNQDLRLSPNDGTLVATDTPLAYAAADTNAGADPGVVGSAYISNVNGATTTTLYGIDVARSPDVLVTQNPPNAGTLNTVGSLGVDATAAVGFDIRFDTPGATDVAFASLVVGGVSGLYTIDLGTGAATLVGPIGAGLSVTGLAVTPDGFTNTTLVGTTATFTGGPASDSITFDQAGGLLRHNRFSAGDPGFNSDFDFDPATPGDQTLSATDPAVVIIVGAGGGDDRVTIGSPSAPAAGLAATFQVNGQGGGDTLTIDDAADATARTVTIDGATSTVTGLGGPITYGTLEGVTVNAGTGGDTINVAGTQPAATSVTAGGGDDTVAFGNGATLSGGFADGGGGSNTLDYSAYTTPVTADLSAAQAQTLFLAVLSGAQEAAPLSNSPASGLLVGTLNAAQTAFTFNVAYQGLTGSPISGTHFHNQAAGVNGPIVRGLFPSEQNGLVTPSGSFAGVWSTSDPTLTPPDPAAPGAPVRPLNAPSPVTPGSTLVQELLAGRIYFNIHTLPNFPSGEVRGQVLPQGIVNPATGTGGVRGFGNVTGGSAGDTLTGNANANVLRGGPGADTLTGGQAGDQVFGDGGDDLLVWNNGDGSDVLEGGANNDTVRVNGSPAGGDQFLVQVNPADPTRLRFDRTNLGLFNLNIGTTEALDFNTLGGDDTVTVDFAGGNPIPVGFGATPGIDFDGGTGDEGTPATDLLVLQRSAGASVAAAETYAATGPGAGDITVDGRLVRFSNLLPVNDTVPTTSFTFTAPAGAAAVSIIDGPVVGGFPTTQVNDAGTGAFELINLANKTNVTVNTGVGPQTVVLNNPTAPAGLATLTVNAGAAADQVTVTAVPGGVATAVNALAGADAVRVTGAGVPAGTTLVLDGGPDGDALTYDAGGAAVVTTAGPGAGQTTLTRLGSGAVVYQNFEQVTVLDRGAAPPAPTLVVSGPANGSAAVFVPAAGGRYPPTPAATLRPFGAVAAALRSAVADVDGDGTPDAVLVTGPGVPIRVAVVSGADNSTVLVQPFDPFGGGFTGGGFVAAGDLDGDGRAEFAVTPDVGGGPRVSVYSLNPDGSTATRANFLGIDDANFRGGARAALGDVNRDGTPDLAVAAGSGGGPRVAVFDGTTVLGAPARLVNDFFAFPGPDAVTLRDGAYVAAGDVDGDGYADLVFGAGPGGSPRVYILSGRVVSGGDVAGAQAAPVANFFVAGDSADRGGVPVAVKDADGDGRADVAAASGEGNPSRVRVYLGRDFTSAAEPGAFQDLDPFAAVLPGGVFVG